MKTILTLAVALLVALAGSALADASCPNTKEDAVAISVGDETYYVWNDMCQLECVFSVWVGRESNRIPGFQLDNEVCDCTPPGWSECAGDEIIL